LASPSDQRLRGFYVDDGMGGRVPSDDYRMIQWYFRNIVYWLIPANRMQTIGWASLVELSAQSRFAEELGLSRRKLVHMGEKVKGGNVAREYTLRDFHQFFYYGQLAEAYLKKARGACGAAEIRVILYKPKIPWWEWVEEIVDPWRQVAQRPGTP